MVLLRFPQRMVTIRKNKSHSEDDFVDTQKLIFCVHKFLEKINNHLTEN